MRAKYAQLKAQHPISDARADLVFCAETKHAFGREWSHLDWSEKHQYQVLADARNLTSTQPHCNILTEGEYTQCLHHASTRALEATWKGTFDTPICSPDDFVDAPADPDEHRCFKKGRCSSLSCLELSDHVAATINRFVNRDRSSRKRARVGEPPTAAPASIEPTHDVEILSVWSLDLSGVGVDVISHNICMVAHFSLQSIAPHHIAFDKCGVQC